MTRTQQVAIAAIAIIAIFFLLPSASTNVVSNAPNLPGAFNALGGQQVLAAAAVPQLNISINPGELDVRGAPTISVDQIERVLAEYNSPAKGQGQTIYDLGIKYKINPAIMLAFFIHESGAGSNLAWAGRKPDGSVTHNVGNIICTEGWRCYGRFRDYDTWEQGIEDWYKLINDLYIGEWQRATVEQIIPRYAPAADNNNEGAYIQSVRNLVQSWQGK